MANVDYPAAKQEAIEVQAAAGVLGFDPIIAEIRRPEDIVPAFDEIKARAEVLYVVTDALANAYTVRINTLVLSARLPTVLGSGFVLGAGVFFFFGRTFRICSAGPRNWSTRFYAGRNPASCPSNNLRNSSSSSI
jgi:hypothetical protein